MCGRNEMVLAVSATLRWAQEEVKATEKRSG